MNKKQVPLDILNSLEPLIKENLNIIKNIPEENCFYSLQDREGNSGYFFKLYADITKLNYRNVDRTKFAIRYFPLSESHIQEATHFLSRNEIKEHLSAWIKTIVSYNSFDSILDDQFLKTYQRFFSEQFNIADEDKNYAPFDPIQQDDIEDFINEVKQKLLDYKTEENATIIEEVVADYTILQSQLSTSTKSRLWAGLIHGMAKTYKWSKKEGKVFARHFSEALMKKLAEHSVTFIQSAIDYLSNPHHHLH
jgi:hypothetical protein